ncbi:hypothetical protein TNCV_4647821 [Trichonephila clavipes]|uniref:Uncharacterized protein n=1 Tax=Trichonephila clavipes TaxID=2585209 RepID=A0A8X6VSE0_TRICX|nr:hypothetical protein TNCV_4647821 [Trichonephila clavipes]
MTELHQTREVRFLQPIADVFKVPGHLPIRLFKPAGWNSLTHPIISDWKKHGSVPSVSFTTTIDSSTTKACIDCDPLVVVHRKPYGGYVNRPVTSTLRIPSLSFFSYNSRHSLPYKCIAPTCERERRNGQPPKQACTFHGSQ